MTVLSKTNWPDDPIERLKRWRDVGDGPITYTSGSLVFGSDVQVALQKIESDAKVISELNVAAADRNLEIEADMKVIAALREALEPFANLGSNYCLLHSEQDHSTLIETTLGMCLRAGAALAAVDEQSIEDSK
jgi:hypothetical protein